MDLPRRVSIRSSREKRTFFMAAWSIRPLRTMIMGLPETRVRNRLEWREMLEMNSSKPTSTTMGTTPMIMGMELSSMGREAMLEMRMVMTSSEGWSSPSCRLPMEPQAEDDQQIQEDCADKDDHEAPSFPCRAHIFGVVPILFRESGGTPALLVSPPRRKLYRKGRGL